MSPQGTPMPSSQQRPPLGASKPESNLALGTLAGIGAAIVGAGIWAAITALTSFQIGWMAIGVGFLVGFAVRLVGKGTEPVFGVVGALLALVGCALGNLLTYAWFIAADQGIPYGEFLSSMNVTLMADIMVATFAAMDLLFYGIAAYCGFRYSFAPAGSAS